MNPSHCKSSVHKMNPISCLARRVGLTNSAPKTQQSKKRNVTNSRSKAVMVPVQQLIVRRGPKVAQRPKQQRASGATSRQVTLPYQTAMCITNNSADKNFVLNRSEFLTDFVIGPTDIVGSVATLPLNPASDLYKGTALQNVARIYQKYRFSKMKLMFANTTGTNNGGSIVVAYVENPDQAVTSVRDIYSLPGSKVFPLWMPIEINAFFKDPRMYNIDVDSTEVMQTTQGKFVIGVVALPTTTGNNSFPLILDYTCTYAGSANQDFGTKPAITGFLGQSAGAGSTGPVHGPFVIVTASSGYTIAEVFTTEYGYKATNPIWNLTSPVEIVLADLSTATASFFRVRDYTSSTQMSVQFFVTLEDARVAAVDTSTAIQNKPTGAVASILAQNCTMVN